MRNLLQQQLLKAGVIDKNKAKAVAHQQMLEQKRQPKGTTGPSEAQREAQRHLAERAERDRALAAEQNAHARAAELRAQVRQIVAAQRIAPSGEIAYAFNDAGKIRNLLVNPVLRAQLASGAAVIVRDEAGYALLPRAAAAKVRERDASMIVLDHGSTPASAEDEAYAAFPVPDDLIW